MRTVRYTVRGEPNRNGIYHGAHCGKESGSVFVVSAHWRTEDAEVRPLDDLQGKKLLPTCGSRLFDIHATDLEGNAPPRIERRIGSAPCLGRRAGPWGNAEAMALSAQRRDHIRRNTTLRLFAGISVITGAEKPTDCAIAETASRSRRPQFGSRSLRLWSKA